MIDRQVLLWPRLRFQLSLSLSLALMDDQRLFQLNIGTSNVER